MHRVDGSLWNVLDPVQAVQWDEEEPKPCKRKQEPNIVLRRTIVWMRNLTLRHLVQYATYLVRGHHQKEDLNSHCSQNFEGSKIGKQGSMTVRRRGPTKAQREGWIASRKSPPTDPCGLGALPK